MNIKKEEIHSKNILDITIRPQDDFFSYVNNNWLKNNPIPKTETRWGTFNVLRDEAWENMREIYEDLATQDCEEGSIYQQARDFYYTGISFNSFEDKHLEIIRTYLDRVDKVTSMKELVTLIGELHRIGVSDPWLVYVDADEKDSTKHLLRFRQSGLTLPNRDYYIEDDAKMIKIRMEYESHARKLHSYFPELDNSADEMWERVWATEYALALRSRSKVELRDVEKNYNVMSIDEIDRKYPNLNIKTYLKELGADQVAYASVDQPAFFEDLNMRFNNHYTSIWKTYLKWQIVIAFYGLISKKFANLRFEFFGRVLSGTEEIMPLWKRVVLRLDDAIGEGVGRLYTERHFPESSKDDVLKLVEMVRDAYEARILNLDWMSEETKRYAVKKLKNIKVLIGYPDKWRDYSNLKIARESYLENIITSEAFETEYVLNKLKQPVSRDEWFMYPQTVNAYHDPNRLVICFPAAILQSPFYSPNASIAENMGGIGTVIAHEFTHGFDDQGCQFDAEGNLRTWQTEAEREAFNKKAEIIINQADKHEVIPGVFLKGKLVIGESIADLGGIEIALSALKSALGDKYDNQSAKDFFTSYARTECGHIRDEKAREFALTDPHPDSVFRVNGIVQHSDDWHELLDVKDSDALYRALQDRAKIW